MSNVEITVQVKGGLKKLIDLLGSPGPVLQVIGLRFQGYVDESFKTSGRGQWAPLAKSTVAIRGRGRPLQVSGKYRQSFVVSSDEKTWVKIGSASQMAPWHERGTGIHAGRGHYLIKAKEGGQLAVKLRSGEWARFGRYVWHPGVPARPVLPTKEVAEKMATETAQAMLDKVVAEGDNGSN